LVLVELRSVPDCPNLDRVRTSLHTALADVGLPPSVLIDGVDVMGSGDGPAACRLDLPNIELLRDALRRAADRTVRAHDSGSPAPATEVRS
jgi:hypothetical protein